MIEVHEVDGSWHLKYIGPGGSNGNGDRISTERAQAIRAAFTKPYDQSKIRAAGFYDDAGYCSSCGKFYCAAHWNVSLTGGGLCPAGHFKSLDPHWSPTDEDLETLDDLGWVQPSALPPVTSSSIVNTVYSSITKHNLAPEIYFRLCEYQPEWNENEALAATKEDGIILTPQHWSIIKAFRSFYSEHQHNPAKRHYLKILNELGISIELKDMFPGGTNQVCFIAGLPFGWLD